MQIALLPNRLAVRLFGEQELAIHLNYYLSAILLLIAFPLVEVVGRLPHFCLFQKFLSIPCPGCGILHGFAALAHFDLRSAMIANPAVFLILLSILYEVLARPIAVLKPAGARYVSKASYFLTQFTISALIVVWVARLSIIFFS